MSDRKPPKIDDAPGLVWRGRKDGWVATWQARSDLIKDGYSPQTARLWAGKELTDPEALHIARQCQRLQADMLAFSANGGFVAAIPKEKTLGDLVLDWQNDTASRFHKRRYATRRNNGSTLRRIIKRHGTTSLKDIRYRQFAEWYDLWSDNGEKKAMGHHFIGLLRSMFRFGMTVLENEECERLVGVLHSTPFEAGAVQREEALELHQAEAIIVEAHKRGFHSIALAQALQFDGMFRQKDVIGEWVPFSEKLISDVTHKRKGKWARGLRWEEISEDWILDHQTSKKNKRIKLDLKLAPLAMRELRIHIAALGYRPAKGPIVIAEASSSPWTSSEFRRKWRICARACGVPDSVWNYDSRGGAISEASLAGAELEHIKHAATHSNISMTEKYSRLKHKKIENVQRIRMAARKQTENGE